MPTVRNGETAVTSVTKSPNRLLQLIREARQLAAAKGVASTGAAEPGPGVAPSPGLSLDDSQNLVGQKDGPTASAAPAPLSPPPPAVRDGDAAAGRFMAFSSFDVADLELVPPAAVPNPAHEPAAIRVEATVTTAGPAGSLADGSSPAAPSGGGQTKRWT